MVDKMQKRISPKRFTSKELSNEFRVGLLKAANLTPTSMGIQPTRLLFISHEELKGKLINHAYNQPQISTCDTLAVLCTRHKDMHIEVEKYLTLLQSERGESDEKIESIRGILSSFYNKMSDQELIHWAEKQTYITLGVMISYCAIHDIDCCPMEGFSPQGFREILGDRLGEYEPTLLLALGEIDSSCITANRPKIRIPNDDYNILGYTKGTL